MKTMMMNIMNTMVMKIEFIVGFRQNRKSEKFTPGVRTLEPDNAPEFNEWCKQYRFSSAYTKDRRF